MKSLAQKLFAVLAFGALLLALLVSAALWRVDQLMAELGIQSLDYRITSLSLRSAELSHLDLQYQTATGRHDLHAQDLSLSWTWPSILSPQLVSVDVPQLQWQISQDHNLSSSNATQLTLPEDWTLPDYLPVILAIHNARLTLPCPAGECQLAARLDMQRTSDELTLQGEISPGAGVHQQAVQVTADYRVDQTLPVLHLQLNAGEAIHLDLHTELTETGSQKWSGRLTANARYPDSWLLDALADWHITLDQQWARTVTQPMTAQAEWQLDVDALLAGHVSSAAQSFPWQALDGFARLDVNLASPVTVQELGEFSGTVALYLEAAHGTLEAYDLSLDVTVTEPAIPPAVQRLGVDLNRLQVQAQSRAENVSFAALPLQLHLQTQGALTADVTLDAMVDLLERRGRATAIAIDAQIKQLQPAEDFQLHNVNLSWRGSAEWQADQLVVQAHKPTMISTDLQADALSLSALDTNVVVDQLKISAGLDKATSAVDWTAATLDGNLQLTIARLQHPQLQTKPWRWQGHVQGSWEDFLAKGELTINNALVVAHQVNRKQQELIAEWQLRDIFFLAGNPFADLVKAWPGLLSLTQGKASSTGRLTADLQQGSIKEVRAALVINELSGIYDTTLFQGLTTTLTMNATPTAFVVTTDGVRVKQINKGFVFGPLNSAGAYRADWQNPTQGKFSLQHFHAEVIGGSVTTPAREFDLTQEKHSLVLTLENIDLGLLLQQHPSTELSGTGRISGTLPIDITARGISVPKGVVAARPPGGQLQYHSERAEALARSQPGMKLITDALEDFHYTVLASDISYDEDGKLLLALRLEGKNPALEKGRPVHFNINLEEDLPAMIASIQLSNQISDVVKKRLQEHLQKRANR